MLMQQARFSSASVEWYTPNEIIEAARATFVGQIELDPASCAEANATVDADRYFTRADDGLAQSWAAQSLWLNPPYGREVKHRIAKLAQREARAAICLTNSSTGSAWFRQLWRADALCFFYERVSFVSPSASEDRPTHDNVAAYFGPEPLAFAENFARFGRVVAP